MKTRLLETPLKNALLVEIDYFKDERGFLIESWHKRNFKEAGLDINFVQEVHSRSTHKVLRGLHYQDMKAPMAKLIRCVYGSVFFVVVDLRVNSDTLGKWFSVTLTADNKKQIFVPVGFAVGFTVLTDAAEVLYQLTGFHTPTAEHVLLWNDQSLAITWPHHDPILSKRDKAGISFAEYKKYPSFI